MRILVACSDAMVRRRLASWVTSPDNEVFEADGASSVLRCLARSPEIAILDWNLPGSGGAELVKLVRKHDSRHRPYVIVYCAKPRPAEITELFAGGADDFIDAAAPREELVGRVQGLLRARSWNKTNSQTRAIELDKTANLDGLRVWREIDSIVSADVGEMLGSALHATAFVDAPIRWCGAIALSLPAERVELRFGIGLTADASHQFSNDVLGGAAGSDAINDALRELANVAGGAVKRNAMSDGVAVTIGLPTSDNIFGSAGVRVWQVSTQSGLRLAIGVAAIASRARAIRCAELREGMVLASDVRTANGLLLVAAGACLTGTSVERLVRLLENNARVEVSEAMPLAAAAAS